jgi:hypothetical protein
VEVVRRSYEAFNKDGLAGAIESFVRAFGAWKIDIHVRGPGGRRADAVTLAFGRLRTEFTERAVAAEALPAF